MSATVTFVGSSFSLESILAQGSVQLRVRFTQDPRQVSPANTNDGLCPQNYSLSGPGTVAVASVSTVPSDTQSLDLNLTQALPPGVWTLTVANITTVIDTALSAPTSMTFIATAYANITGLTAGAEQDDAAAIIRKHLTPALGGPTWDALIAALGIGDQMNWDNAQLAFDQMFEISASGKYLDRLASNEGLTRPQGVGMADSLFRQLVIQLTNEKITHKALRQILEIFYGRDSVRAYAETALGEPFQLLEGQTLMWRLDEDVDYQYEVVQSDYAVSGRAKAIEVATAISKVMSDAGSDGFAVAAPNPDGTTRVRIYSGALGLRSGVRVTGGTGQLFLRFPALRATYGGTVTSGLNYTWNFSRPSSNVTQMTLITTGQALVDVSTIEAGDYMVVGPGLPVPEGSYPVTLVEYSWSGSSLTQILQLGLDIGYIGSFVQSSNNNFTWFQPTHRTSSNGTRSVVVAQTEPGKIDIQLPATTQAVNRGARLAAYGRINDPISIQQYVRDGAGTLTIYPDPAFGSGPPIGSRLLLTGFAPAHTRPWVSLGTPGTYPAVATADASYGTTWSATQTPPTAMLEQTAGAKLNNGDFLIAGGFVNPGNTLSKTANRLRLGGTTVVSDNSEAAGSNRQSYQWIATASMNVNRWRHGMTTLIDGRVLATGGMSTAGAPIISAELYDPTANTWTVMPTMATNRGYHAQVTMQDGRVLVCGGNNSSGSGAALSSAEIFNPATLAWTTVASMNTPRQGHKALVLADGRVLVTGGGTVWPYSNSTSTPTTELYDPTTNTWVYSGNMTWGRAYQQMVQLPNGCPMVFGGRARRPDKPTPASNQDFTTSAEVWTPLTGQWTPGPSTQQPWAEAGTCVIGDRLFVGGTSITSFGVPNFIESLSLNRLTWTVHFLADTAHRDRLFDMGNGKIALLTGGNASGTTLANADLLIGGMNQIGGGGINGVAEVAVSGTTSIQVKTPAYKNYAVNTGDPVMGGGTSYSTSTGQYTPGTNYSYGFGTAQRTSNVTTLTLLSGLSTAGLIAGQQVYVNLNGTGVTPAWQTLTSVTDTTLSYADPGSNTGALTVTGAVTINVNPNAQLTLAAAQPRPLADPGPYIFDPDDGIAVTSIETTLTAALLEEQQSDRLQVTSATDFPDAPGFIVLDFGTAQQSAPVRYLEKIGTNLLLLDFSFKPQFDYPVGTEVTFLSQRGPYVPDNPLDSGNFYLTGSQEGRIAAQSFIVDAAAAGFEVDTTVVYPGDRGLGGEGFPTEGTGKLSDIVEVFGADDEGEEG